MVGLREGKISNEIEGLTLFSLDTLDSYKEHSLVLQSFVPLYVDVTPSAIRSLRRANNS